MPSPLITYRGVVYPWHCDHMGHMNVMWYVGKFDEATWNVFHALGLTLTFLRENGRGMAAVEQTIAYKRECLAGDVLHVTSRVDAVKEKAVVFTHEMVKAESGEVAATTTLTAVHLDAVARRATAFPAEIAAKARELMGA